MENPLLQAVKTCRDRRDPLPGWVGLADGAEPPECSKRLIYKDLRGIAAEQ